jgi:hypothetical protein
LNGARSLRLRLIVCGHAGSSIALTLYFARPAPALTISTLRFFFALLLNERNPFELSW